MDKTSDLPTKDTTLTKEASQVMDKYFSGNCQKGFNWKLLAVTVITFIVLSCNYATTVVSSISFFQNPIFAFVAKVGIFTLVVALAMYFL